METVYLTKIPIFDDTGRVYGFEIKYEFEEISNKDFNMLIKSLYKVLSDIDIAKKVEGKPVFIQLAPDIIIFTDFTSLLPNEIFTIKVSSSGIRSRSLLEKLKELKLKNYKFCLSDLTPDTQLSEILKVVDSIIDYIEIDLHKVNLSESEYLQKLLKESRFTFIADNIDTFEELENTKRIGFKLFKGDFFTKPEKVETSVDNFSKLETLRLIRIVHDEDDLNSIAEYIKASPSISVSLLKYINSSFFYLANPIASVNRAVIYLGKKNLINWLILLSMISVSNSDIKKEAVKRALFRGKFMELITKKINSDENIAEMAFLVGILSLSEAIFNLPLENIASELNFNQNVVTDIKEKRGFFGKLLNIAEMVEKNKSKNIKEIAEDLTLEGKEIMEISLEALKWSEDMFGTLYR